MGFGDVRLSFLLGLYLGCLGWARRAVGLFLGFVYGAVIGVVLMATGRAGASSTCRSGRSSRPARMTIVLVGGPILDWYRASAELIPLPNTQITRW